MRYINKEYGFAFRPPFHNKFYEERKEGPPLSPENFPHKVYLGAGYDYTSINGAILVGKNGTPWGIKVSCLVGGKWFDNDDFIHRLSAASANTKDGSFAHFASGPFSAKWVKASENGIYLQLSARKKMRVRVIFYPCFGFAGELSIENTIVKGRSPYLGIFSGSVNLSETGSIYRDRK
ncbi:MAG: hypothetical protein FWC82_01850, partial [Firmicutes bacterium]|nr:hypothetical protein [Bacillota bacterium]